MTGSFPARLPDARPRARNCADHAASLPCRGQIAPENRTREDAMAAERSMEEEGRLRPGPIELGSSASTLIDQSFLGSTAGRVATAAQLLTGEALRDPRRLLGVSLDATLIPTGVGVTALAPLIEGGYIDWLAISGTNLYYDALLSLGTPFFRCPPPGEPSLDCGGGICVRARDVTAADATLREILAGPEFQDLIGTAALHDRLGAVLRAREKSLGIERPGLLSTAHELRIPIYNPAPGDNPLGSLTADLALMGNRLAVDPSIDLNDAAALLNWAGREGRAVAIWCLGRGAAANFLLEAARHLRAIFPDAPAADFTVRLRMAGRAHVSPAANPLPPAAAEAGEVSAETPASPAEPRATAARTDLALSADLSVTLPLLAAYMLDRLPPRQPKRLHAQRDLWIDQLRRDRLEATIRRPSLGRPAR
ncbi:MAG: hypothetical protein GF330_11120 [Candidatus Eisenbacteria bacterium]|nr:hypothetical protein [Candidatus Eisenbacteria bacterium]